MIRLPASPALRLAAIAGLITLGGLSVPTSADAQLVPGSPPAPRWWLGADLSYSQPQGPFGDRVDHAWGFQFGGRFIPRPAGPLGLRLDFGLMRYGSEVSQVCLPAPIGCRIGAEVETDNDIVYIGVGPELNILEGRIYAFGTLGTSVFVTSSSLSGLDSDEALLSTNNQQDATFAWRAGGGVRIPISSGSKPIRLDIGVDYHGNGVAEYLVEGDVVDNPDGTITIFPNRTEANVLTWRLGFSVGLGGS